MDFTCRGIGNGELKWVVGGEGSFLNNATQQLRDISVTDTIINGTNHSSTLTITALPINDGLEIGCHIYSNDPFHQDYKSATLTIEGKLYYCMWC